MKTRASTAALLLLLSSAAQGDDLKPLTPRGKEDFLAAEFLKESSLQQQGDLALDTTDAGSDVLVGSMKGLLLLGSLDTVERNPVVEGVELRNLTLPGKDAALLQKLSAMIVGQPLTQNKISAIRKEIIGYYQENNHPVVAVIVPEQDVTDGVLQVGVIEGKIGEVTAKGGRYFRPERMMRKFDLKQGESINTDELLSDVAWANQNPFRQTNIVFIPGATPGTTNIDIVTNDRAPLRVYIGGDNTGNHFTGRNRWYAGFNWGDVFGLDQTLSFQYTTSSDFHKFQGYTLNYTIPLPWHNTLTFFGGYSRVHPDIDSHIEGNGHFKNKGWSGQASVRYIIPFGKTYGNFLQNFQAGYDFKVTNNSLEFNGETASTKVAHVNQFLASYYAGYTPQRHKINADIDVYFSPGNWYGDENKKAFNSLEKNANPSYIYTRLALGDEFTFSKYDFGLYLMGRAQFASRTLVPSEQFGLGGYDTVRGYEQRLVNYDDAVCLNFELRAPHFSLFNWMGARKMNDQLTFLAFVDYGIGWPHKDTSTSVHNHLDPKSQTLVGVGPGLRYRIGPWFYARVDYGFPLTNVNDKGKSPVLDFGLLASY